MAPIPNHPAEQAHNAFGNVEHLVRAYFEHEYSNLDIVLCLASSHGVYISIRTVKRILKRLGLRRRVPCTEDIVKEAYEEIESQLRSSGRMIGYKTMWKRLQHKGIRLGRNKVRELMLELDYEGVQTRRRKRIRRREYLNPGPNFVWHVDGYDKLKPYGFAIHGAIDGFSRRILWLEVGSTNNNPKIVAKHYLDTILQLKTLPRIVRVDKGTENVCMRDAQIYLRTGDDEFAGENSFMEGKSVSNQRIEAWWCILRKQCVNYWINLFKDMITIGLFDNADRLHIEALRFCFMDLIEMDIKRTAIEWNTHNIEKSRRRETPCGKPDIMYNNPVLYDTESYGCNFHEEDAVNLLHNLEQCGMPNDHDPIFVEMVNTLIPQWDSPDNVENALSLYVQILDTFAQHMV